MDLEQAVNISRLFIPVIAVAGIFIAWQQFLANREKVRFDLYQRRLDIYKAIVAAIEQTNDFSGDEFEDEVFTKLRLALDEAFFLLPHGIYQEMSPIQEKSWEIRDILWSISRLQDKLMGRAECGRESNEDNQAEYMRLRELYREKARWFEEDAHRLARESFKKVLGFYKF